MSAQFPDTDTIREALTLATRAPSIYNTQPWRWRLDSTSLPFGDLSLAAFNGYYLFILAVIGGDVMVARFDRSPGIDPSLATGSGLIGRGDEARQQMHRYDSRRVDKRVMPPERTNS